MKPLGTCYLHKSPICTNSKAKNVIGQPREIFLFGLLTAPVINTKIKSDLGKERFTPACRLQSVSEGKQGRNSRQEVKAETIPWLTALPRDSTAHGGLGTSISNHEANLRRQYLK